MTRILKIGQWNFRFRYIGTLRIVAIRTNIYSNDKCENGTYAISVSDPSHVSRKINSCHWECVATLTPEETKKAEEFFKKGPEPVKYDAA